MASKYGRKRRCRIIGAAAALAPALFVLSAGFLGPGTATSKSSLRHRASYHNKRQLLVTRQVVPDEMPDVPFPDVVVKPGMTPEEYLQAAGYGADSLTKSGDFIVDLIPKFKDITPAFILQDILFPAFIFFVISVITTPLQDKLLFGKDYEIDWSGKSGRLYKLFTEGPDAMPEAEAEIKFSRYDELKQAREEEEGPLVEVMKKARAEALAEQESRLQEEVAETDSPPASKPKLY